jgi:hypothetical protein
LFCALLSGFWTKALSQGAATSAAAQAAAQPDTRSLESWAAQRAGHGDAAGASKAGGRAKGGVGDAAQEERVGTPPQEEPRLCYVDLAGVDGSHRLSGSLLLDWAAQQEEAAWGAWEESVRDWEEGERQRHRVAAEAARQRRREEANSLTVRKQHEAVAALESAKAAVEALESQGGALPVHGGDWDAGRRRKPKRLGGGIDDMDAPGDAYAKRMRAQDAGLGSYGMGGAQYPHMMDAQGGGGGAQPKRRKGDADGDAGDGAAVQRNRNKKARQTAGQAAAAVPQPLPWSDAEMKLLVAAVREFGRPRPNWALVSDVLAQGALLRGVYRRPDACCSQWEAVAPTVLAQEAQAAAAAAAAAAATAAAAQPVDAMQADPPAVAGSEEGRNEDEDARLQRRRTLLNYLPVEPELLRQHLQRLCLVGQKYKTHRDGDPAVDAGKRAPPVHASWGVALAEAQSQLQPDLLVTSPQQPVAQAAQPVEVKTAPGAAPAAAVLEPQQPDVEMPEADAPSKPLDEPVKTEEPAAVPPDAAPPPAVKAEGNAPAPRSRARSSRR